MVPRRNTITLAASGLLKQKRDYWMLQYKQCWFDNIWALRHNPIIKHIFKRISIEIFQLIVDQPIALEKRVAVAVWRLAIRNAYRTVSNVFGVSDAIVSDTLQN